MNLQPIKTTTGDAAQKIQLFCYITGAKENWNDAARKGWKVDLDGKPFSLHSYYSPERQKKIFSF